MKYEIIFQPKLFDCEAAATPVIELSPTLFKVNVVLGKIIETNNVHLLKLNIYRTPERDEIPLFYYGLHWAFMAPR